jgi:hypothetical protein
MTDLPIVAAGEDRFCVTAAPQRSQPKLLDSSQVSTSLVYKGSKFLALNKVADVACCRAELDVYKLRGQSVYCLQLRG